MDVQTYLESYMACNGEYSFVVYKSVCQAHLTEIVSFRGLCSLKSRISRCWKMTRPSHFTLHQGFKGPSDQGGLNGWTQIHGILRDNGQDCVIDYQIVRQAHLKEIVCIKACDH